MSSQLITKECLWLGGVFTIYETTWLVTECESKVLRCTLCQVSCVVRWWSDETRRRQAGKNTSGSISCIFELIGYDNARISDSGPTGFWSNWTCWFDISWILIKSCPLYLNKLYWRIVYPMFMVLLHYQMNSVPLKWLLLSYICDSYVVEWI